MHSRELKIIKVQECTQTLDNIAQMSSDLIGIGLRLREIRKIHDLTQSVMAAKIDVSDRACKYYEQEKRDIPAHAAAKICESFDVNLEWLLLGRGTAQKGTNPDLAGECAFAVLSENETRQTSLPPDKLNKIIAFVFSQALQTGATPAALATQYFDTL